MLSVENGVISQYSQRWSLFIDPQSQANKWIKIMARAEKHLTLHDLNVTFRVQICLLILYHCVWSGIFVWHLIRLLSLFLQERDNGLDVMKLSDRDFLRSLENAIRFGKPCLLENVGEELDPALDPVLLRQVTHVFVLSRVTSFTIQTQTSQYST